MPHLTERPSGIEVKLRTSEYKLWNSVNVLDTVTSLHSSIASSLQNASTLHLEDFVIAASS
jgi:hypothetical protein